MPPGRSRLLITGSFVIAILMASSHLFTPAIIAATPILGDGSIEATNDPTEVGVPEATRYTASASGTIDQISIYLDSSNAATSIALGIYNESGGRPGSLLTSATLSAPANAAWNSVTVASISIAAGQPYWIARLALSGGSVVTRGDMTSSNPDYTDTRRTTSLPASFSAGPSWPHVASLYASAASSPPTPTPTPTGGGFVGNSVVETGPDPSAPGTAEATQFVATTSGQIDSIFIFLDGSNASTNIALGIYSDAGNVPGALLTQGSLSTVTNGAWNRAPVPPITVNAATRYWIARLGVPGSGRVVTRGDMTASNPDRVDSRTVSSLPSTFSPGASYPHRTSLYAGASGATPTPTPPPPTPAPTPTPTPAPGGWTCMEVIGFSQTYQWYFGGGQNEFLSQMPPGSTQLRWQGGASIDAWADPNFSGWSGGPSSATCASGSANPDRVVLTITGGFNSDVTWWHDQIAQAVANARARYSNLRTVFLQPVVGGPGHGACFVGANQVRATYNEPYIGQAIDRLQSEGVGIWGANPLVRSCSDYADDIGHLTDSGRGPVATTVGAFYSAR